MLFVPSFGYFCFAQLKYCSWLQAEKLNVFRMLQRICVSPYLLPTVIVKKLNITTFFPSTFNFKYAQEICLPMRHFNHVKQLCSFYLAMVFCYQNCSDLLWEKNVLVIEKIFWNSRLKAEKLATFYLFNLFKTVKGQNNFW